MIQYLFALALLALSIAPEWAPAYPLDGDVATGIRRLTHARLVQAGQLPGPQAAARRAVVPEPGRFAAFGAKGLGPDRS
jgi:hypothetical protein